MEKKNVTRQICLSYVRDRYRLILLYALFAAAFFVVAALYGYRQVARNMLYALELTAFLGIIFILIDYVNYRAKCRALFHALQKETERTEGIPEPRSLPEMLYVQLIVEQEEERRRFLTGYDQKQKDMADYYTMWTHQIKTPIAALRLLMQSGQGAEREENEGKDEIEQQEGRLREEQELFKIEQYAQMALYFARLDSPSSDFFFKQYDVKEIVKQAVRKYAVLFLYSGLSFRMEEFKIRAVTDEKWLGFVVEQVFSNALKYTRQGGIMIYGADRAGEMCQEETSYLVIEDTGIGIDESDLPRIFERGYTGYNGRMERKSTGLGLYLCDRIMGKMSHTIRVLSEQGRGTKVILGFVQENDMVSGGHV